MKANFFAVSVLTMVFAGQCHALNLGKNTSSAPLNLAQSSFLSSIFGDNKIINDTVTIFEEDFNNNDDSDGDKNQQTQASLDAISNEPS